MDDRDTANENESENYFRLCCLCCCEEKMKVYHGGCGFKNNSSFSKYAFVFHVWSIINLPCSYSNNISLRHFISGSVRCVTVYCLIYRYSEMTFPTVLHKEFFLFVCFLVFSVYIIWRNIFYWDCGRNILVTCTNCTLVLACVSI